MSRLLQFAAIAAMLVFGSICAAADPFEIVPSSKRVEPIALVGTDLGAKVGVGLVFVPDGPAAAYVCDGKTISVWFTGTLEKDEDKVALKNDAGDTLSADWAGDRRITCEAKIAGTQIKLNLELAVQGKLLRDVETVDGEPQISGMVITNRGATFGARNTRSGKVVSARSKKAQIEGGDSGEPKDIGTTPGGGGSGGGGDQQAQLFKKLRCKILESKLTNAIVNAQGPADNDPKVIKFTQKGRALGCDGTTFQIPNIP